MHTRTDGENPATFLRELTVIFSCVIQKLQIPLRKRKIPICKLVSDLVPQNGLEMRSSDPKKADDQVSSHQSVTEWLEQIKVGDNDAAQKIWDRYIRRLIQVAAKRLRSSRTTGAQDEEDAVVVAFANFLDGAAKNRFSKLGDRNDLWQILVMLTDRRVIDQIRRENARGTGTILGESPLERFGEPALMDIGQLHSPEPSPDFAMATADELRRLFQLLDAEDNASDKKKQMSEQRKMIAIEKMKGCTTDQIAEQLNIAKRTVEDRLREIRNAWLEELNCEQ